MSLGGRRGGDSVMCSRGGAKQHVQSSETPVLHLNLSLMTQQELREEASLFY